MRRTTQEVFYQVMSQSKSQNVVILGCGRVGSTLARQLYLDGNEITVVDITKDSFRRLGPKFKGHKIVGNGLDQDTLRKAGVGSADTFIAVTQGDNSNIMAAQLAQEVFKTKRVIARIYDPIRSQAYRDMGITTLCTTTVAANMMRQIVLSGPETPEWQDKLSQWDNDYLDLIG